MKYTRCITEQATAITHLEYIFPEKRLQVPVNGSGCKSASVANSNPVLEALFCRRTSTATFSNWPQKDSNAFAIEPFALYIIYTKVSTLFLKSFLRIIVHAALEIFKYAKRAYNIKLWVWFLERLKIIKKPQLFTSYNILIFINNRILLPRIIDVFY